MRSGRGHGHSAVRDRVRGALCIVFDRRRKGIDVKGFMFMLLTRGLPLTLLVTV